MLMLRYLSTLLAAQVPADLRWPSRGTHRDSSRASVHLLALHAHSSSRVIYTAILLFFVRVIVVPSFVSHTIFFL